MADLTPTLAEFVRGNSYTRVPSPKRMKEGRGSYKKGYEIRIIVKTWAESRLVRKLLRQDGISPGAAFRKAGRWAVPVYGLDDVLAVLKYKRRSRHGRRTATRAPKDAK